MTTPEPLISILIPCHNAERWIGEAIESALAQTWAHKEIIVLDDGSTDGSLKVIRKFGKAITCESGPNRGGNVARNRLLAMARGEWLQYLDADDYLLADKISCQVDTLSKYPRADVIYSPVTLEWWSASGEVTRQLLPIDASADLWVLLARWHLPQTGAPLWRREAINDVGSWKEDQPCCQEHELYFRLLSAGRCFVYSESPGATYRQWGEHTVCKRDKPEVRRRRLEILGRIEAFLETTDQLTLQRRNAINLTRFEIARSAYATDLEESLRIIDIIRRSQPGFTPTGAAAPAHYRALYRLLGFERTERIARARRQVRNSLPI
jgi:hypothetical protein